MHFQRMTLVCCSYCAGYCHCHSRTGLFLLQMRITDLITEKNGITNLDIFVKIKKFVKKRHLKFCLFLTHQLHLSPNLWCCDGLALVEGLQSATFLCRTRLTHFDFQNSLLHFCQGRSKSANLCATQHNSV